MNFQIGDLKGNAEKIIRSVSDLKEGRIDLIVTSEMALSGYPPKDLLLSPAFIDDLDSELSNIALILKDHPPILIGSIERNTGAGNPLFNSGFLLMNGKVIQSIHKKLLPNYDVFDECRYFESSKKSQIIHFKGKKLGITICEDVWNDDDYQKPGRYEENPLLEIRNEKVDLLINLSSSPFTIGKQKFRETMLSKIASRSRIPILYVNQVGGNDELVFDGSSCAFDNRGELVSRAKAFKEDILIVDLPDSETNRIEEELDFDEKVFSALVLGTRDYIKKCGFNSAVIGLSGGIDSSLTAVIAKEALGADNLKGVIMPSPYSSQSSKTDALILAENLGIETLEIPISGIMDSFDDALSPAFKDLSKDLTEENIQARIRGNLLMAMSNKFGSILLTTGNKSELAVGYCTIYGDMSGGLAVISDLPKTLVCRLSSWINQTMG
ncbi:MAG: NAD+ synthase, partial [Deltaproteobacteria bacterium]|nr:NAD+ synthase [Deltaproteobacteria bacterium]